MAKFWKEHRQRQIGGNPDDYAGPMRHNDGPPPEVSPDPVIIPEWIYCVRVCGFTFQFWGINQISAALEFYSQKTHRSSRLPNSPWLQSEHDVAQRWYERAPLYLQKNGKRERVVKALKTALEHFESDNNQN